MADNFCYFNGKVVRFGEIKISPFDLGFVRGYGIFDAMRTANGSLFCFSEHWKKFQSSAQELNLKIPVNEVEFGEIIKILLEKNNFKEMAVKTVLTGGVSKNGFVKEGKETFLIIVDDLDNFILAPEVYRNGAKIISREYARPHPEMKNLNYLFPLSIQKEKNQKEALEIVYKSKGKILECSSSNIFMVKDGVIITAKNNIFKGTTRNLVLELAKKNNFKVEKRDIEEEEFYLADEIFLTATYKKIVPVVRVDERMIGGEQIGPVIRKMMEILNNFIETYKE